MMSPPVPAGHSCSSIHRQTQAHNTHARMYVRCTAGYNGNLFETSNGSKGGDFDKAKDSCRFVVGQGTVIPGLEEGIKGMQAGGVRQIVVPPEVCVHACRVYRFAKVCGWCMGFSCTACRDGCWFCALRLLYAFYFSSIPLLTCFHTLLLSPPTVMACLSIPRLRFVSRNA